MGGYINDMKAPHLHYALYKKQEGYGDQEARRKKLLRQQKSRREDFTNYVLRIVDGEGWEEMEEENVGGFDEVDTAEDAMQVCVTNCSAYYFLRSRGCGGSEG